MASSDLPLTTRLWFAWACFFRVLFDAAFAGRAWQARQALPEAPRAPEALPAKPAPAPEKPAPRDREEPAPAPPAPRDPAEAALQLLALLQREGRLVDFLEQDIASFADADVGAAARVVHEGCRKALRAHAKIEPVRAEDEGARVTVEAGYPPAEIKLIGDVHGAAPYRGVLRHRGWRAASLALPKAVADHDARVLAPAEVEL